MTVEARVRRAAIWLRTDEGARWTFWAGIVVAVVGLGVVGRHQWFTRDDWAFVLTREKIHQAGGLDDMLFAAQDGHWMTIPIIAFRLIHGIFGTRSYWPYLIPTMACHLGIAVMIRTLCTRVGVTAWTASILAVMFAVFGNGWENIVFAVQLTYNLSMLAFLVHLVLIDHEGPPNRRDAYGVVAGLVAISSSGFGPFFIFGTMVFMLLRGRWKALAIAVVPTALAEGWWWLSWGQDPAGDQHRGGLEHVPAFVNRGAIAVFDALTSTQSLVGIALLATLGVLLWRDRDRRAHDLLASLALTTVVMYVALAIQRGGFGTDIAASSRYVYMGAVLVIPVFGVAVDQLRRIALPALWAGRLLLMGSVVMNAAALGSNGDDWAAQVGGERTLLELVAGSQNLATADPNIAPLAPSPDVHLSDLPPLIADGAIHPRPPSTPDEQALVDAALRVAGTP